MAKKTEAKSSAAKSSAGRKTSAAKTTATKASANKASASKPASKTSTKTAAASAQRTDAIKLLTGDHDTVEALFKRFEAAKKADKPSSVKGPIAEKIIHELTIHTHIEEEIFYPALRKRMKKDEDDILEAYEEHHAAKVMLVELSRMKPVDERYDAKMKVIIEMVRHHKEEEESELFPKVRKAFKAEELGKLGEALLEAKKSAPTTPSVARVLAEGGVTVMSNITSSIKRLVGIE